MFKYLLLTVIFDIMFSTVYGFILGLVYGGINPNTNFLEFTLISLLALWTAVITSAHICYKNKKLDASYIKKAAWIAAAVYIVVDIAYGFLYQKSESLYESTIIVLTVLSLLNVPFAFLFTRKYLKKYSV